MTPVPEVTAAERSIEGVSSVGLVLNVAAVVVMAVALAGLGLGNGLLAACSAVVAVLAFAGSLACFAIDGEVR